MHCEPARKLRSGFSHSATPFISTSPMNTPSAREVGSASTRCLRLKLRNAATRPANDSAPPIHGRNGISFSTAASVGLRARDAHDLLPLHVLGGDVLRELVRRSADRIGAEPGEALAQRGLRKQPV